MSEKKKITAISLFSGAGGDTLGMKNCGINVVGYVEYDKNAIETHKQNFPECKLIGKDITEIKDEEFEKYKDIDIIFGGFPCQSFSQGGKKKATDKRGFLYQEFVRATKIIKPKLIIGENVQGLLSRKMEDGILFIDKIIEDFTNIGYTLKYNLFNMENFGIPQSRKRVLIYGIRNDLDIKCDLDNVEHIETKKYNKDIVEFSLQDALKVDNLNIINEIKKGEYIKDMKNKEEPVGKHPTNLQKCYDKGEISFRTRASPTHSCIIDLKDVSRTILCSYGRMPRLFVSIRNYNGFYLRPYTITELQMIQGFPKDFKFHGNYINQVNQIGNAVPPIFITHILTYIKGILTQEIVEL
jgi:DNA (cytosine-5)-methyltransferase 1